MKDIKAAWKGEERLWKVFWIYNFLFGIALGIAMDHVPRFGLIIEAIVYTVVLIWAIRVFVALWRCAFNARWKGWGYVVRGVVVLGLVGLVISIFGPINWYRPRILIKAAPLR